MPIAVDVPTRTSRSVAILPLRATGDLVEVADGLSEELVDTLSMTRSLRVRPLASVRKAATADADARELGQQLGVDVVVEGSLRRRGDNVRITARVVGVADGFQLWASHVDSGPDGLLGAGDDLVQAIAKALTVELAVPERANVDPRAGELYLEGKAKTRANWLDGQLEGAIEDLEQARLLAPDDPAILATLSLALARSAFYGAPAARIARARALADRAVSLAPSLGEAHIAVATACLYDGAMAESAAAIARAVHFAPGSAVAQAMLGAALLEVGALDDAISHLEASTALDPLGLGHIALPRAYVYAGRWQDALAEFARAHQDPSFDKLAFDTVSIARFKMWRGEPATLEVPAKFSAPPNVMDYVRITKMIHDANQFVPEARKRLAAVVAVDNRRLRMSRAQFMAEFLMLDQDVEEAMRYIGISVDAGLQDHMWMQACPMLAPLRGRADFQQLAEKVAERAKAVLEATRAR
jgi:serine/threonine-protein kinase